MRRKNTFQNIIALTKVVLPVLTPITILAGLLLGMVMVNLSINELPPAIKTKQEQELATIRRHAERDRAQFDRLRKKHGSAAAVVITEPGENSFYYGPGNEGIALK